MTRLYIILFSFALLMVLCQKPSDQKSDLSDSEVDSLLIDLAVYLDPKPKGVEDSLRFEEKHRSYYKSVSEEQKSKLLSFYKTDTANFYLIIKKDLKSLYDHYRVYGGYYKVGANKKITFLNQLVVSPRLLLSDAETKGKEMFDRIIQKGNLAEFYKNNEYMEWPNPDVAYDPVKSVWYFPEGSKMKVFEQFVK